MSVVVGAQPQTVLVTTEWDTHSGILAVATKDPLLLSVHVSGAPSHAHHVRHRVQHRHAEHHPHGLVEILCRGFEEGTQLRIQVEVDETKQVVTARCTAVDSGETREFTQAYGAALAREEAARAASAMAREEADRHRAEERLKREQELREQRAATGSDRVALMDALHGTVRNLHHAAHGLVAARRHLLDQCKAMMDVVLLQSRADGTELTEDDLHHHKDLVVRRAMLLRQDAAAVEVEIVGTVPAEFADIAAHAAAAHGHAFEHVPGAAAAATAASASSSSARVMPLLFRTPSEAFSSVEDSEVAFHRLVAGARRLAKDVAEAKREVYSLTTPVVAFDRLPAGRQAALREGAAKLQAALDALSVRVE